MERPLRGDIVVVPFPFSDLSQAKRRPALVLAELDGDDLILCQVTSKLNHDRYAIALGTQDFSSGLLNQPSNVRPNRLFTADRGIILYKAAALTEAKLAEVIDRVIRILRP